jgi:hypothetical protein
MDMQNDPERERVLDKIEELYGVDERERIAGMQGDSNDLIRSVQKNHPDFTVSDRNDNESEEERMAA